MKLNDELIGRLEDALQFGATVSEACYYAGASRDAFYHLYKSDKDFLNKMEAARIRISNLAVQNIDWLIRNGDTETSKWFLEKKIGLTYSVCYEIPDMHQ